MTYVNACHFLWKIKNFSVCIKQNRHYIKSLCFVSKVVGDISWRLIICLAVEHCERDYLTLSLERTNLRVAWNDFPDGLFLDVGLVNELGDTSHKQEHTFDSKSSSTLDILEFVERSAVLDKDSKLLLNDVLTLKGRIWRRSSQRASPEKVLLRTTLAMEKVEHIYTINPQASFQFLHIRSTLVPSGYVLSCSRPEIDHGVSFEDSETDPPTLYIRPVSDISGSWTFVTAKIRLIGRPHEPICRLEGSHTFGSAFDTKWQLPNFQGPFDQIWYNEFDQMHLLCDFTISNLETESTFERTYSDIHNEVLKCESANCRSVLVNDMRLLLQEPAFSDIQVQVGKIRIPAHQVVLSARSKIFCQLLKDGVKDRGLFWRTRIGSLVNVLGRRSIQPQREPLLNETAQEDGVSLRKLNGRLSIVLSNVEERIVRKIVSFLYTDDVGCVDHDTTLQLLRMAHLYRIPGLKLLCETLLSADTITIENSIKTFCIANVCCLSLMMKTVSFINDNFDCVMLYLDSLTASHEDKDNANYFGIVRGENRNHDLFPDLNSENS